jgi:hypothetical protein
MGVAVMVNFILGLCLGWYLAINGISATVAEVNNQILRAEQVILDHAQKNKG